MRDGRHHVGLIICKSYLDYGWRVPLLALMIEVFNLCKKSPCQMIEKFYVYMSIIEAVVGMDKYEFDVFDVL